MADPIFYEPTQAHPLKHDPLNAIVAPRPIGWISTVSVSGVRNLAPYSFFNLFNYRPPIVGFASIGWKHSAANAEATGACVWNLATRALAEAMNATSTMAEVDEFAAAGLEAAPCRLVSAPRVAASPVAFECRLTEIVRLRDAAGAATDTHLVLGEVVGVHIDPTLVEDGIYRTDRAEPITRGGGPADYFALGELFRMRRPQ